MSDLSPVTFDDQVHVHQKKSLLGSTGLRLSSLRKLVQESLCVVAVDLISFVSQEVVTVNSSYY